MSSEAIQPKKSLASKVASVAAFPVAMTALGGVKSVIRNGGVKPALDSRFVEGFRALNKNLGGDCFSKGITLANNYNKYSQLQKTATHLAKIAKKAEEGKLPLKTRFFNLFRKDKVTADVFRANATKAQEVLTKAQESLKNGEQLIATTGEAVKTGFGHSVGNLIGKGLKDPVVWMFTALETMPEVIGKVIPTFKEKGFKEGMKETGKTLLKAGGNTATYVASSAIGRAIGSAIGFFVSKGSGNACAIGGNIGSMIAVSLGNILKGKIFKPKEQSQNNSNQLQQPVVNPYAQKTFTA